MPVEVEAGAGAQKVAGEDEADQQFFADGERIELLGGDGHQGAGGTDDQRGHAGEAGGDGVCQGVAVEWRGGLLGIGCCRCAKVDEGQHDDGVVLGCGRGTGLAEALGEHGEDAGGALLDLGRLQLQLALRGELRDGVSGHSNRVKLEGLHDGAQALAHIGGGGEAGRGLFFQAAHNQRFQLDGKIGDDLAQLGRVVELNGADGLEIGLVGFVEGMASGDQLVEDDAEGEYIGLHAGAAGDELLRRHVGDGAATSSVGGPGGRKSAWARAGGIEVGLVHVEAAGKAEVEYLDEAAIGEHDVGGLEVAVEDAELVRGGEAVGDLDSGGERELQAGRALGDDLVERLAWDVLHDDVGLVLSAGLGGGLADVVDGGDVGVVDGRGQAGLAQLRGADLLQRLRAALEQLEDDRTLQERVGGQVDDARPTGADLAQKLVVADCAALHALIIARLRRDCGAMLSTERGE